MEDLVLLRSSDANQRRRDRIVRSSNNGDSKVSAATNAAADFIYESLEDMTDMIKGVWR